MKDSFSTSLFTFNASEGGMPADGASGADETASRCQDWMVGNCWPCFDVVPFGGIVSSMQYAKFLIPISILSIRIGSDFLD